MMGKVFQCSYTDKAKALQQWLQENWLTYTRPNRTHVENMCPSERDLGFMSTLQFPSSLMILVTSAPVWFWRASEA